tara:strand:+ start:3707 stop:3877 length:171 start_codon:yes stop_codon:yes gene_type:complete
MIRVKLKRGLAGSMKNQRLSVRGLGLKKINQVVEVQNTPENLGMIKKAHHLLEVLD